MNANLPSRCRHVHATSRPPRLGNPTPYFGQDTDAILAEAGYSEAEIAALKASGAAVAPSP